MVIVGVLGTLTVGAVGKARSHAENMRAVAGAKALITAFQLYSTENNGAYLPGVDRRLSRTNPAYYQGRAVTFSEAPHRYPFRLAPYLNDQFQGTIWLGNAEENISKNFGRRGTSLWDYGVSVQPSFGMNIEFVGGEVSSNGNYTTKSIQEALTHSSDYAKPSTIVFATSGSASVSVGTSNNEDERPGWHEIKAPIGWHSMKWKANANPIDYGYVSARFNDKAIVAMLDGSVHMMGVEEMRDMRLWSKNAQAENDKNYVP